MSIGPSLVGVSGATGATSRVIGFAASAVLLGFAFSPKLSGFFLLVPSEVAGSLLVFTASFMISGGMQVMLSRPVDTRAVFVIGVSTRLRLPSRMRKLPRTSACATFYAASRWIVNRSRYRRTGSGCAFIYAV